MESNAILFFSYSLIFWIISYLVIRNSRSTANVLFSSATFLYGVGTLFSAIGWYFLDFVYSTDFPILDSPVFINRLTFFSIAASFIVIAPLGIYFSGRVVLIGEESGYKDSTATSLLVIFFLIAIANIFIYPLLELKLNFMLEDSITLFVLFLSLFVYVELYNKIPEYKINFLFIILGLAIGIVSLFMSIIVFLLNLDDLGEMIRSIGPFLGVAIIIIAFTNLPQSLRNQQK